ncbi:MAG: RluA family pseudouridine synthase [Candidatus Niyogibacteria bacterium]|nr:RluA family pseudouridine synthase [Candidatus Niyogibacteria bacterium]
MEPQIIYEDKDIAVVNKPAGMSVHHDAHHTTGTLADFAVARWPEMKAVGDNLPTGQAGGRHGRELRPGIVHRLDKDTSGVIVLAKTQDAFEYLKGLFQRHEIVKKYLALVVGELKTKEGVIEAPIGRGHKDPTRRAVSEQARGKMREAVTHYKVAQRFGDKFTLLEVTPETGRTHQIRVHLAAIKHPILGDRLYGGKYLSQCPPNLKRQFLHAASLELATPSGTRLKFEAELPADLAAALAGL